MMGSRTTPIQRKGAERGREGGREDTPSKTSNDAMPRPASHAHHARACTCVLHEPTRTLHWGTLPFKDPWCGAAVGRASSSPALCLCDLANVCALCDPCFLASPFAARGHTRMERPPVRDHGHHGGVVGSGQSSKSVTQKSTGGLAQWIGVCVRAPDSKPSFLPFTCTCDMRSSCALRSHPSDHPCVHACVHPCDIHHWMSPPITTRLLPCDGPALLCVGYASQ